VAVKLPENPSLVFAAAVVVVTAAAGAAIGSGIYFVLPELEGGNPRPKATLSEFGARYVAKGEYTTMDSSAGPAVCDARKYHADDDLWEVECRLDRNGDTEITLWEVTPDLKAELIDTTFEAN
jgi:hypothetical protein